MGPRPCWLRTDASGDVIDMYYAILQWGHGRTCHGQNSAVAMDPAGNVLRWGRGRASRGQLYVTFEPCGDCRLRWGHGRTGRG